MSPEPLRIENQRSATTTARENGLSIARATKAFETPEGGLVHALDDVSLDIREGEFFVLLGPSGCGKTTLLRSIAGLEVFDSGEIYLGTDRIDQIPAHRRPVNTVFQSYALFPHLTVAQNVAFGPQMDGLSRAAVDARVAEMLALVQLEAMGSRKPSQLSGGQQQRVTLARALAKDPRVLLLDEPLAALDLKLRRQMQAELKDLQQRTGLTFVFVTHDQEEALALGDRIAVLEHGRVAQVGTPQEIYETPETRFVADFIGETSILTLPALREDGRLTVRVADGPAVALPRDVPTPDGTVTIAVRPERLVLDGTAPPLGTGTLTSMVYMGTDVRCTVSLGDVELRVRVAPPYDALDLRPGATVTVGADPRSLRPLDPEPVAAPVRAGSR
ncbi:ABC transporter ATP-binding protein [Actinotalea sp.]|uniref:ABC transporter ATP-binding protein n=1 Tax=Actinotalea sp. TaxID=1872145 RepID=UPI00356AA388